VVVTDFDDIKTKLDILESRISEIEHLLDAYFPLSIEKLLEIRGFKIVRSAEKKHFYDEDYLFNLFKSYYFRRILHDVLTLGTIESEAIEKLSKKWGGSVSKELELIVTFGFAKKTKEGILVSNYSASYMGEMLEWFIGKFLSDILHLEVITGVRIGGLDNGGDIDVLSRIGTKLIAIECKESPPNNVPVSEMQAMYFRNTKIKPDLFIFLIDTTLSIKRNILDNLEWITKSKYRRMHEGVYEFDNNLFVINAKRTLLHNLEIAIREGLNGLWFH